MIAIGMLICLASLLVHGKVITINNASSNTSRDCCTVEGCVCGSLATALKYINSNTVINITSPSVALVESIRLLKPDGVPPLTNIMVTGNNIIIMCNNSGSIYCDSCDDVMIKGITWDKCGNPFESFYHTGGLTFDGTGNISLINCTFQYSLLLAVTIIGDSVAGNVTINHCSFLSNRCEKKQFFACDGGGALSITFYNSLNILISNTYFYDNKLILSFNGGYLPDFSTWNVTIAKTNFTDNMGNIKYDVSANSSIQLLEVTFSNSNSSDFGGLNFLLTGKSTVLVSNSLFSANINFGCTFHLQVNRG